MIDSWLITSFLNKFISWGIMLKLLAISKRPLNAPHRGMSQKHANRRRMILGSTECIGFSKVWCIQRVVVLREMRRVMTHSAFILRASSSLYLFHKSVVKSTECSINRNSWGSCRTEYGRDVKNYKEKCQRLRCSQINNQVTHAPASSCWWRGFPWVFTVLNASHIGISVFLYLVPLKPWAPPCFVAVML